MRKRMGASGVSKSSDRLTKRMEQVFSARDRNLAQLNPAARVPKRSLDTSHVFTSPPGGDKSKAR
jgi:hypothetical protein